MGEESFVHSDHNDSGKFQALGRVHGHQGDAAALMLFRRLIQFVRVGYERHSIEKSQEAFGSR